MAQEKKKKFKIKPSSLSSITQNKLKNPVLSSDRHFPETHLPRLSAADPRTQSRKKTQQGDVKERQAGFFLKSPIQTPLIRAFLPDGS